MTASSHWVRFREWVRRKAVISSAWRPGSLPQRQMTPNLRGAQDKVRGADTTALDGRGCREGWAAGSDLITVYQEGLVVKDIGLPVSIPQFLLMESPRGDP